LFFIVVKEVNPPQTAHKPKGMTPALKCTARIVAFLAYFKYFLYSFDRAISLTPALSPRRGRKFFLRGARTKI
jgi:hypothetical protein